MTRREFVQAAGATAAAVAGAGVELARAATNANEICRMDAVTLAQKIRRKELSPVEVTDAVLARMEKLNPLIGAFCTPTPDLARQQAKQVEAAIVAGKPVGPLAGVPIGIKDLVETKGIKTTSGSILYKDYIPTEDDVAVERLKNAGAIILGKTNVPELGFSGASYNMIFPPTKNPWNLDRTAGGSSSGSGAAAAAGIGPFALGGDAGGSIRIPASINGLYGLKGSMGRVPLYPSTKDETAPGVSGWESLAHSGPLSRTVADAALMMSVIAGADDRDRRTFPNTIDWVNVPKSGIKGLKVAFTEDWGYQAVDPEVRSLCSQAAKVFQSDLGCEVEAASPWNENYSALFFTLALADNDLRGLRELVKKYKNRMMPHLVDAINGRMTDEQITDAVMTRKKVANQSWRFMRKYDLLLTPTIAVPAFAQGIQGPETIEGKKVSSPFEWIAFTYHFNLTGQPAASVPVGFTKDGLPVGLQIVGRHLDDVTVLKASYAFEMARPWKDKWPPILPSMNL